MSANDVLKYVLVTSLASELSFHCCFACSRAFVTAVVTKFVCTQAFFYVSSSRKKKGSQEVGRGESTSPTLQLLSVIESSLTVYPKFRRIVFGNGNKLKSVCRAVESMDPGPKQTWVSILVSSLNPCVTLFFYYFYLLIFFSV